MTIQPTQPQSIGGVLDTTFQLYKASIVRVLPLSALMAVAGSIPSVYMMMKGSANPTDPLAVLALMKNPMFWLAYLVSILATIWAMAGLYLKIGAIGAGGDLSVGSALQQAAGRTLPLFLMTILFFVAIVIGCVLLLVPGLILMVSLIPSFCVALYEDKSPVAALTASHRLVWGNWWRTTGILTVGFIIVIVIYMLAGVLIGVVMPLAGLALGDLFLVSMLTGVLIGVLMNLVVTPFYLGLVIAIYWDLKLRKEGGDLAARIGSLNPA